MHRLHTAFILGYHGCDQSVAERLLTGESFKPSENDYDWLGSGIYFWEANPRRGLEFAAELSRLPRSSIQTPAVVGAVIDLGLCIDLSTSAGIATIRVAHSSMLKMLGSLGIAPPVNNPDGLRRNLDCKVVMSLHGFRAEAGQEPVDSIRGIFVEGKPIYENSGFHAKTHVQICIRNPACIKGVFRVPAADLA